MELTRPGAPRLPLPVVAGALWAAILVVVAARSAGLPEVPVVTTLGIIFTSIVVEALPFIMLGATVSAAIAVFVPDRAFARLATLPRALQLPGAAVAGVGFPVCECGSVPVARRLLDRGIDPGAGVAFMLAAPILNPLVLAATWVAYDGQGKALEITVARAGLGLGIAVTVGWIVGRMYADRPLLRNAPAPLAHEHPDDHGRGSRGAAFAEHTIADFLFMAQFLVLGAGAAAVLQTLLPQDVLSGIGGAPVLAALTMVALAFALSLCSEADAFVAVSFTAFPLGAQLAFLVVGPMLDLKLAVLYGATFRRAFILVLVAVAVPAAVAGSLLFDWILP